MRTFWRTLACLAGLLWAGDLLAQTAVSTPGPGATAETFDSESAPPTTYGNGIAGDSPPVDSVDGPVIEPTPPVEPCSPTEGWPAEGCPEDYGPAHFITAPHGWSGSVGFLALTRSLYEPNPLFDPMTDSPGGYDSTFGGYHWGSGIDLRLGHRDPSDRLFDGWEARYFGVSGAGNNGRANTGGDWTFPGDTVVWPQAILRAGIDSGVQSAEWNLQHDAEQATFTWLAGFRWLQFEDSLWGGATIGPSDSMAFRVSTANSLYGGQVGLSLAIVKDQTPLEVDVRLMAGLYSNSSSGDWMLKAISPSTGFTRRGADSASNLAFSGDLEFSFVYRFTERWSAALSYEALWLQGVAVAGDQSELGRLLARTTGLSTSEAAWFSGLNVGLRFRW
jgi:hypothetical protein